jgi:hypothetical protein
MLCNLAAAEIMMPLDLFAPLTAGAFDIDQALEWTTELQTRLRTAFLVMGSGTWQSTWVQAAKSPLGFGAGVVVAPESIQPDIEKSGVIPAELFRRFNSELIILPPATEDDYRRGSALFGLDNLARELGCELDFARAAEQGLGARWLEETFARLLRLARKQGKNILPPAPRPAPDPSDQSCIDSTDFSDPESDTPF